MHYKVEKIYSDYANVHTVSREALHISNAHGIKSILIGGSLLGFIRDGDLLPWDKDIDFAVFEEQAEQVFALEHFYRKAGFEVRHHFSGIRSKEECEIGFSVLTTVCSLLADNNIKYSLTGGALLNVFRDGKIHPQTDTLAILIEPVSTLQLEKVKSDLSELGKVYVTQIDGSVKSICLIRNDWRMNLFTFFHSENSYYWKDLNCIYHCSGNLLDGQELRLKNQTITVPSDTQEYLRARYGEASNRPFVGSFERGRVHGIMQIYKEGVLVDYIIHYQRGAKTYWFEPKANVISSKGFRPATLQETSFGRVLVPDFPEIFLSEHYGDWSVPVRQWDGAVDNPTIIPHQLAMDNILERIDGKK